LKPYFFKKTNAPAPSTQQRQNQKNNNIADRDFLTFFRALPVAPSAPCNQENRIVLTQQILHRSRR
jgi:hypothetical protein